MKKTSLKKLLLKCIRIIDDLPSIVSAFPYLIGEEKIIFL